MPSVYFKETYSQIQFSLFYARKICFPFEQLIRGAKRIDFFLPFKVHIRKGGGTTDVIEGKKNELGIKKSG